jgi:cytochrome c peroxidase
MNFFKSIIACMLFGMMALSGCITEELPDEYSSLNLPPITHDYAIGDNDDLTTLGRVLFYDPRLSINNTVSCASCHKQALAFADDKVLSEGFDGLLTTRNSMSIHNIVTESPGIDSAGFKPTALFWDGRQRVLQNMVLEPIQNHIEMGSIDLPELAQEISAVDDYKTLFKKAGFGPTISPENLAQALSAFLLNIQSTQSRFDLGFSLTQTELLGQTLFFDTYNCNSCHNLQQPFNGYQSAGSGEFGGFSDIGLDPEPVDGGVFRVTGDASDEGKFKIPSLRNVALTAPYMHDGRFATLDEVLHHYSEGINRSANLDERLQNPDGSAKKFEIPESDKVAIKAFLHTLNDLNMMTDQWLSSPFR